ncbi:MAG TPA: stage III sporulation protein AF [Clostridiales bacterium]|nr:stage III sporulation protein AF [Clostridiales bacterium]HOL90873.1 stage III sporulation protein AF [Clostridiales bacterium]HPP35207.1 stage III sporulation protein AF [Clostridiales bacterium]
MLEFIKNWTANIVVLVLFIVITEMLLPKGKVKKYANLMTGTILIIAIIEPVTGLFGKSFDFTFSQAVTAGSIDKKEIEKAGRMFEEEQVRQTIRLYRNRIIEQIEHQAREVEGVKDAKADVIINEDSSSPSFGEIKRIYIEAEVEGGPAGHNSTDNQDGSGAFGGSVPANDGAPDVVMVPGIREVERIRIGGLDGMKRKASVDRRLEERLSERIANAFGVNREHIIITQVAR